MDLHEMSKENLRGLAAKATELAADLEKEEPTEKLALEAGVRDVSYDTQSCGWVRSYRGEGRVTMANGSIWRCVGHRPKGNPSTVYKQGWIEFIPEERAGTP